MNWDAVSKRVRINPVAFRLLIEALMSHPHTYDELVEATGLHRQTLIRWLAPWRRRLDDTPRRVRIAAWEADARGRPSKPAFEWGDKRDAPRPRMTNAERQQRVRDKRKALALQATVHSIVGSP